MVLRRSITMTAAAGALLLAGAGTVIAQTGTGDPLPVPRLPAPDETIPEQVYPCNPGDYEPPDSDGSSLTEGAIDCGEVIVPPQGMDPEISAPAPEPYPGTTPVIPPSALEQQ